MKTVILSIDFSNIMSFLLGIITGMTILSMVIVMFIVKGKKESKLILPVKEKFDEDKIKEMILNKQNDFIFEVEENDKKYIKTVLSLSMELLHEISSYYYPNSKYPEYELTVNEAADTIKYIVDQIIKIFDRPLLRSFKNIKISLIASAIDKSKKVKNNTVIKAYNDSGASDTYKAFKAATNIINPIYWFRKAFVQGTINITIKKVCKAELSILGVEANKVYSKDLFRSEEEKEKERKEIDEILSQEGE